MTYPMHYFPTQRESPWHPGRLSRLRPIRSHGGVRAKAGLGAPNVSTATEAHAGPLSLSLLRKARETEP